MAAAVSTAAPRAPLPGGGGASACSSSASASAAASMSRQWDPNPNPNPSRMFLAARRGQRLRGAVRRWSEYVGSRWPLTPRGKDAGVGKKRAESYREEQVRGEEESGMGEEEGKWSWERWKQHFALIEESERLVDELQLQLRTAVYREDFRSAHKLKLAIAATSKNDTVGRAIYDLNSAIEEERYMDAAYIRDHVGAGLLGWWSGISGNLSDPYGLIIRISAEHGRYVAKSYDIRQLNSDGPGFPIFEIYFAEANEGYNLQAVHLKPDDSDSQQLPNMLREKLDMDSINISSSSFGAKHEDHSEGINMDDQNSDDSDISAGPAGFKNLPSDSTPVPRVKILKVVPMENVNQDYIIKIFDQMSDDEDDNDNPDSENESSEDIGDGDNVEEAEEASAEDNVDESGDESDIEGLISIDFITEDDKDFTFPLSTKSFERMPARLERRDRFSFSFYTEQYSKKQDMEKVQQNSKERVGLHTAQQDDEYLQFDRVKLVGSNRKLSVLQLGIKQHNNKVQQKLFGVTHFNRIQMPVSSDPLTEDDSSEEHRDLQFYEYVEAVKLTGDNLVPAGQVVFRAKVGKHYQLPHKGIIPRELGVVARYKGERRIADPGFQNPRWVDGELLILDGKFIRDGPVIAFFYWTSNFHLFEFFRRLKLPD
uniref:Uncharacterized protein n=1 Tax=Leersia perrieri TaxID=77586 RepID=A0A0D9XKU4_9ORYZ